jgi:aerobic-type carbon monoxide dehydrogenase small subunit (CoxS/CutS family)
VLLDGEEVRACITPISNAVGKQVSTIEGLPAVWAPEKSLSAADAAKTLHPIQQAWIDEQVPQCGYCQSGMMIVAVQLLAKNPNPTVAQIKDAFTNTPPSPHLCRCRREPGLLKIARARLISLLTSMSESYTEGCSIKRGSGPVSFDAPKRTLESQSMNLETGSRRCAVTCAIGSRTTPMPRMK